MSQKIPVLSIGLPAGHPAILSHPSAQAPGFDMSQIAAKLKLMEQSLQDTPYSVDFFYTGPEDDFQTCVDKLKEKEWKAVVVGFGVRGHPGLTEFFEKVVNAAHRELPAAVFCFNVSPESTLAALERNLPVA